MNNVLFWIQTQGYKPVLAHHERYWYYHKDKKTCSDSTRWAVCFNLTVFPSPGDTAQVVSNRLATFYRNS